MRTVLVKDLEPGMIIKCGFMVLSNVNSLIAHRNITFLTGDCRIYISRTSNTWDYEVFQ